VLLAKEAAYVIALESYLAKVPTPINSALIPIISFV
jgi:hypothetical protein